MRPPPRELCRALRTLAVPPSSRVRATALVVLAGLLPFGVGCAVHRQGIDLLEDGLWLLGGRVLADGGWLHRDLYVADGPARYAMLLPSGGCSGATRWPWRW